MEHWELVANGQIVVDKDAEDLWENMCSYFKFCDDNPITSKRTITSGKGAGTKVSVEQKRPYTIENLCLHCGISPMYLKDIKQSKDKTDMYFKVVERAELIIRGQLIENAIVGEFNPIFTAKYIGMDKGDDSPVQAIKVIIENSTPELANSEKEILEKMDLELERLKRTQGNNFKGNFGNKTVGDCIPPEADE
jgi:predicted nucleic-acid-binding Zn-ribbon protein